VYYLLFAGITIGNAICNWTYKRTFFHWDIRKANIKHYITPFFVLGLFAMLSAIYTKLSLPVLSFLTDDQEAGNYATATRVYQVIIALVSTLTAVMIPRMSVLMKENRFDKVREYSLMSFKLLFIFSFPIICFMEIFAPDIIRLFAGTGFEGAILPMRIIMPQLIIIGAEKIIVLQLLIPLRKDRTIVMAGLIGVFNWCIFTALLVPTYHNIGTSIVWVIAELTVLLIANRETQRSLNIHFPVKLFLQSCLYAIPYLLLGWGIYYVTEDPIMRIILSMVLFIGYATLLEFKVYKTGILQPVVNIIKRVT
jgi:O-antigen/teichoic acid export membrane protein